MAVAQRQVQICREVTRRPHFIEDKVWVDCEIVGPAVLAVGEGCAFEANSFPGPFEQTFWTLPDRPVTGPILLTRCTFRRCRFGDGIGIVAPPEVLRQFGVDVLG